MTSPYCWLKIPVEQGEHLLRFRFLARADQLQQLRKVVRGTVETQSCAPDIVDGIVLAVNEACMNIIQHAYAEQEAGEIILEILSCQDELVFRLTDFARPIDKSTIKSRDLDDIRPGGLGVYLIDEMMDKAVFLDPPDAKGNILEMRKRIKRPKETLQ